jgi:sigma-B regulation protein RsbU (phosphoserine phosphatase)
MNNLHALLFFFLLAVGAAAIAWILYPTAHPLGGVHLAIDRASALSRAEELGESLGADPEGYWSSPQLSRSSSLLRQLQQEVGMKRSNELTRSLVPAYAWDVRWRKEKPSFFSTPQPESSDDLDEAREGNAQVFGGDIRFRLDGHGNLIGYRRRISDTTSLASLSSDTARALAREFLDRYTMFRDANDSTAGALIIAYEGEKRTEHHGRTDYQFSWTTRYPGLSNDARVQVSVAGDLVSGLTLDFNVPRRYRDTPDWASYYAIVIVFFYVAVVITMIVLAFRRWRAGELGFRTALALGIVAVVMMAIELSGTLPSDMGWTIVFPLVLGPLFVGCGLVFLWAVSDSMGREAWKDKFASVDFLLNGYVQHSKVGLALVRGVAIGLAALAVYLGTFAASDPLSPTSHLKETSYLHSFFPALQVLTGSFYKQLYALTMFFVFIPALLKRGIRIPFLIVVLTGLIYSLGIADNFAPLQLGLLVSGTVGLVFAFAHYRFDVLTVFLAMLTFSAADSGLAFLTVGQAAFLPSGYALVIVFAGLFIAGSVGALTKDPAVDVQELAPGFARYISDRERMQQELEIARRVQMTFLPKQNPDFRGLQIASRCAPALEVGGDYYDFVQVSPTKLGVAIGDVSGKGTQAAFYMTLTKGFLRALAVSSVSPSAVLTDANRLFYENVDRGAFISMVYSIFDAESSTLTLARAGHNPVIMRKPQSDNVEVIHPTGLALGLEPGEKFAKTIQEVRVPYQPGDLFVFYTDGFPEAMNKKREEFGEDRLCRVVEQLSGKPASEVLDGVFKEMQSFVGKAKQHDDMTIVVVRVL